VAKAEWGTKRLCQSCGTKFYDFRRSPALCPKCGVKFEPKVQSKPQRVRAAPSPVKDVAKVDAKAVAATAVIDKDDREDADEDPKHDDQDVDETPDDDVEDDMAEG